MSLEGDLSELPFVEIVQLYGTGRQPVAVHLQVPGSEGDDGAGVFCLEEGKLTDAKLGKFSGRDAFRRALALSQGPFRVEMGVRAQGGGKPELLSHVLIEELARLDEERQAAGAPPMLTPAPYRLPAVTPGSVAQPATLDVSSPAPGAPGSRKNVVTLALVAAVVLVGVIFAVALRRGSSRPDGASQSGVGAVTGTAIPPGNTRGVSSTEVVFGMASPLNGANRDLGRSMKLGVELAFMAANDGGGVHGRKLRLVALDDGNEPETSAKMVRDLVEQQQVFAILGNAGTTTASAALPFLVGSKVVYFGAVSGAPTLRKDPPDRYVFNYRPSLAEETSAAVRYLVDVRRIPPDKIAVFAEEDEFGEAGFSGVAQQMKQLGRNPAQVLRVGYARKSADVDAAVAKIRQAASQVKGVVMIATYAPAARFIQRVKGAGMNLVFLNVSAVNSSALAEQLREARLPVAGDVVITQVVPNPLSRATAVSRYRKLLEEKAIGEQVGTLSLEGYIVGSLAVEALRRAGPALDNEKLVQALEGIRDLDIGIGTKMTFGPQNHQASHKVWGTALDAAWTFQPVELE